MSTPDNQLETGQQLVSSHSMTQAHGKNNKIFLILITVTLCVSLLWLGFISWQFYQWMTQQQNQQLSSTNQLALIDQKLQLNQQAIDNFTFSLEQTSDRRLDNLADFKTQYFQNYEGMNRKLENLANQVNESEKQLNQLTDLMSNNREHPNLIKAQNVQLILSRAQHHLAMTQSKPQTLTMLESAKLACLNIQGNLAQTTCQAIQSDILALQQQQSVSLYDQINRLNHTKNKIEQALTQLSFTSQRPELIEASRIHVITESQTLWQKTQDYANQVFDKLVYFITHQLIKVHAIDTNNSKETFKFERTLTEKKQLLLTNKLHFEQLKLSLLAYDYPLISDQLEATKAFIQDLAAQELMTIEPYILELNELEQSIQQPTSPYFKFKAINLINAYIAQLKQTDMTHQL